MEDLENIHSYSATAGAKERQELKYRENKE